MSNCASSGIASKRGNSRKTAGRHVPRGDRSAQLQFPLVITTNCVRGFALSSTLKRVLSLAGPMVASELGLVTMGIVDTLVVGRIGPEAIGAVGLGNILFLTVAIFGMGLLLATWITRTRSLDHRARASLAVDSRRDHDRESVTPA
ncbi:MAG: hypothetical protein GEU73_17540 [Chloroflexi bacterium]|nr:hypothetical protein [Chloroflexota bacterium]